MLTASGYNKSIYTYLLYHFVVNTSTTNNIGKTFEKYNILWYILENNLFLKNC